MILRGSLPGKNAKEKAHFMVILILRRNEVWIFLST